MKDTSSNDEKSIAARVTEAGEAIGERVQSATAATAAVTRKKCLATRVKQPSRLGRKQAKWRRTSLMRVGARPNPFRGRSASIQ